MTMPNTSEVRLVRDYLLGHLAEGSMAEFEDRLVADGELFERVEAALDDLDDSYVAGGLSSDDRRRYGERYRFTPEGRARVGFARALRADQPVTRQLPTPEPKPSFFLRLMTLVRGQRPVLQFAIAAAGIVLLAGPPVAALRMGQLERRLAALQADLGIEAGRTRAATDSARSERAGRASAEQKLAALTTTSFDLFPGTTRGENLLAAGLAADVVRFRLALEQPLPRVLVRVELVNRRDQVAWSAIFDSTATGASTIPEVFVPGSVLMPGEYQFRLSARNASGRWVEIASYRFVSASK